MSISVEGGAATEPRTLFLHSLRYPRAARPSLLPPGARRLDFTFLCQTPDGRGEVNFGREWGLMLMQIFNVNRFVSANPPPATPPRPALRPGHTGAPLIYAAPQRLRGRVTLAQVVV